MPNEIKFWSCGEVADCLRLGKATRNRLQQWAGFGLNPKPLDKHTQGEWSDSVSRFWPLLSASEQCEINAAVARAFQGMEPQAGKPVNWQTMFPQQRLVGDAIAA